MAIINRVSRLFTADIHAVLDRMEEPVVLLRQCIREMEEELADSERRVKALACEREQITNRQKQLDGSLEEIESQLDICFESGEEDLARGLIRRRLQAERLAKHLVARAETADKEIAKEQAALDENRARLEGMRQKALTSLGTSVTLGDEAPKQHGWLADSHRLMGDIHYAQGKRQEAIVEYGRYLELSDRDAIDRADVEAKLRKMSQGLN